MKHLRTKLAIGLIGLSLGYHFWPNLISWVPGYWDSTVARIKADLALTIKHDTPAHPTPEWRTHANNTLFWESEAGRRLFRQLLVEDIADRSVTCYAAQDVAMYIENIGPLLEESITAHSADKTMRKSACDLFRHVDPSDRDPNFMTYVALHDSNAEVRRDMFYQLPSELLSPAQLDQIASKMVDPDEWIYAQIGAAWILAKSGDARGLEWSAATRRTTNDEQLHQLLSQVDRAGS